MQDQQTSTREQMVQRGANALRQTEKADATYEDDVRTVLDAVLPQVSTVEELEALPHRSVIIDDEGQPWSRWLRVWRSYRSAVDAEALVRDCAPLTVVWTPPTT